MVIVFQMFWRVKNMIINTSELRVTRGMQNSSVWLKVQQRDKIGRNEAANGFKNKQKREASKAVGDGWSWRSPLHDPTDSCPRGSKWVDLSSSECKYSSSSAWTPPAAVDVLKMRILLDPLRCCYSWIVFGVVSGEPDHGLRPDSPQQPRVPSLQLSN